MLAPPAVAHLRAQGGGKMERSISQDIREEREELREAAEQSLNVIVDLGDDGLVRWVSPSWVDVIGTPPHSVEGKPIASLIVSDNKSVFSEVADSMKKDDSRSQMIRISMEMGELSQFLPVDQVESAEKNRPVLDLEAQGIMVYDKDENGNTGESHSMWMLRPWEPPREIKIDLPPVIVECLGSGAEVLASYLTQLAESSLDDPSAHPKPDQVLCRICERHISPWWFEKHTELCMQEHRAEMDVQMAQENLMDHRHLIVRVLDALEARKSRSLSVSGDQSPVPMAEYKGLPIGPPPSTASSPGSLTPVNPSARSRERSSGFGHSRGRSFAIRRPQARIVELLLDLCDTAIEISTPAIKESSNQNPDNLRTQSPQSESRISQVLQWQSPSSNTLEQEQGLAFLCADTEKVSKAKVEAVLRHRRILEYSERIRIEFAVRVQDCIDDAVYKANKIAHGHLSESASDTEGDPEQGDDNITTTQDGHIFAAPLEPQSNLATALARDALNEHDNKRMSTLSAISAISGFSARESTRSSSPKECQTPRSSHGGAAPPLLRHESRRQSMVESEAVESDGSIRSSSATSRPAQRTDSPLQEFADLRRAASTRQHNRKSWIMPGGTASPRRQESPSRGTQPSSPLRLSKPRNLPLSQESVVSPQVSPMLPNSEFSSPIPQIPHHHLHHHRRQSSTTNSEFMGRPPPSPRLNAVGPFPHQSRAAPPSIKDFEIIKPISKGAFGSVYLSKKKSTAEYFAIKVLKKADMVAKNQVTNVKAERAIMMWQGESDFVAKLYWTFSSKDYLYLVMEYLNGGDCASLIKILGGLPEDWTKKYLAEVVLGVEHLHSRGIIHRDLKPDNLLIDQKGHLKLTDFGLSRMGLVGRQKRALNSSNADSAPDLLKQGPFARSTSITSSRSTSLDFHGHGHSPNSTPQMTPDSGSGTGQPSYFSLSSVCNDPSRHASNHRSDSGGSETLTSMFSQFTLNESAYPGISQHSRNAHDQAIDTEGHGSPDLMALQNQSSHSLSGSFDHQGKNTPPQVSMMPPPMALFNPDDSNRRFVGTPDYLAPETIKGEKQDETSDWWSVGCIMFEFIYGIPPFHAPEAELVFENILARRIKWPEDEEEYGVSPEAKDLMNRLLCMDPRARLGSNKEDNYGSGGEEIRSHPWFEDINWETLREDEAQFVPQTENPEDLEYFDSRGASMQQFTDDIEDINSPPSAAGSDYVDRPHDALSMVRSQVNIGNLKRGLMPLHIPPHVRDLKSRRLSEPNSNDSFGSFTFKNLPVLEKANKDVIQKLRAEAMASQGKNLAVSPGGMNAISPGSNPDGPPPNFANPVHRNISNAKASSQRPQSPSGISHANSSPNRMSQPSSPLLVSFVAGNRDNSESRRKVSNSSSGSLAPGSYIEVPRVPPSLQKAATTVAASPIKGRGPPNPLPLSPQKGFQTPRQQSASSRSRSLTVGSQESSPVTSDLLSHHRNRRSQVFDMSPSSSDNEGDKANALLRVQRRRQSSRRLSQIAMDDGPLFRPLDVLICEDHPVSRMVMEKLLEKLRCRTISASNGPEAVRYSMSDIKFDVIFMEFKLPHISGADVARMIRETKNANSHTPIVAITAYLKELQAPHYFDSLVEKPISSSKLTEVLCNLCQWKPAMPAISMPTPPPHPVPAAIRHRESSHAGNIVDSPTSGSSIYAHRGSSISSSHGGDSESVTTDEASVLAHRKLPGEYDDGLCISQEETGVFPMDQPKTPIGLVTQQSSPAQLEHLRMPFPRSVDKLKAKREHIEKRRYEGTESADDEDEELGTGSLRPKTVLPSSKLGTEMMRANSHDSLVVASSDSIDPATNPNLPSTDHSDQRDSDPTPRPSDEVPFGMI